MPVISVNGMVDKERIIQKMEGQGGGEEGSLAQKTLFTLNIIHLRIIKLHVKEFRTIPGWRGEVAITSA
jgi:hypothetical protein